MPRQAHARNVTERSTSGLVVVPDSLSGEAQKIRFTGELPVVHRNRSAKPVAVNRSVAQNRHVVEGYEMTPILVILFVLSCIALEVVLCREHNMAKEKAKNRSHSTKA
jgi:hypothetical protein